MFSVEHFYAFMSGTKELLKTSEYVNLIFPNYYSVKEFQKQSLLNYCLDKPDLKKYLPDTTNLINIPRNFLLCVSFLNKF